MAESPERSLILLASSALSAVPPNDDNHTVAAAARSRSSLMFTGVNVFHFTGGLCAELVVLGVAAAGGVLATDITTMVAVRKNSDTGKIEVINPCGRCRQVMLDYNPDMHVIVLDEKGKEREVEVKELLPFAYVYDDGKTEGKEEVEVAKG
jgi:cytidine deaminase